MSTTFSFHERSQVFVRQALVDYVGSYYRENVEYYQKYSWTLKLISNTLHFGIRYYLKDFSALDKKGKIYERILANYF